MALDEGIVLGAIWPFGQSEICGKLNRCEVRAMSAGGTESHLQPKDLGDKVTLLVGRSVGRSRS